MKKGQDISNAAKLLREYRPALWQKTLLEAVPNAGNTALEDCLEQINFTRRLAEALRDNKLLGEKLYQVIRATYLSNRQPVDVDEILDRIANEYGRIPRRTYFRLRSQALRMMDIHLKEKQAVQDEKLI